MYWKFTARECKNIKIYNVREMINPSLFWYRTDIWEVVCENWKNVFSADSRSSQQFQSERSTLAKNNLHEIPEKIKTKKVHGFPFLLITIFDPLPSDLSNASHLSHLSHFKATVLCTCCSMICSSNKIRKDPPLTAYPCNSSSILITNRNRFESPQVIPIRG